MMTRIVQTVLAVAAIAGLFQMVVAVGRGKFLVLFLTARLVLALPFSDMGLVEAGQGSCPVNLYHMMPE